MGKGITLTIIQRSQLFVMHQLGHSQRDIANYFNVSKSTVFDTIHRYNETNSFSDRPRSGRPLKTTERTDNLIRRYVKQDPFISSTKIAQQLRAGNLNPLSARTIRLHLFEKFGLRARRPARKPFLLRKQRLKRLRFCHEHKYWKDRMWRTVLFSDETIISQFKSYRPFVRRSLGTRLNPRYLKPIVKHSNS